MTDLAMIFQKKDLLKNVFNINQKKEENIKKEKKLGWMTENKENK